MLVKLQTEIFQAKEGIYHLCCHKQDTMGRPAQVKIQWHWKYERTLYFTACTMFILPQKDDTTTACSLIMSQLANWAYICTGTGPKHTNSIHILEIHFNISPINWWIATIPFVPQYHVWGACWNNSVSRIKWPITHLTWEWKCKLVKAEAMHIQQQCFWTAQSQCCINSSTLSQFLLNNGAMCTLESAYQHNSK